MNAIYEGCADVYSMFASYVNGDDYSSDCYGLFPVVFLSSELISRDEISEFVVK